MYSDKFTLTKIKRDRIYFYVLFRDKESNKRLSKKSVEKLRKEFSSESKAIRSEKEAIEVCNKYLAHLRENKEYDTFSLSSYLSEFYDYDKSPYIKRRLALKSDNLGKDYAYNRKSMIDRHVINKINKNLKLSDLKLYMLEGIQMKLINEDKLKPASINMIMHSIIFALKQARRLGFLNNIIDLNIENIKNHEIKNRGIYKSEDIKRILDYFENNWRMKYAILLSLSTGLRSGEIRALRVSDINEDNISVNSALARLAGRKLPKGRKSRIVPCPKELLEIIVKYANHEDNIIFYSKSDNTKPVNSHYFSYHLNKALDDLKIENREEDMLCFHTFRHMANSYLSSSIDQNSLQLTIGHTSNIMSMRYMHLTDDKKDKILKAQEEHLKTLI